MQKLKEKLFQKRTKQGIAAAKSQGKLIGRQKGQLVTSKYDTYRQKIEELYFLGLSVQKIVDYIGIGSQPSLSTYIKTRNIKKK